MWFLLVFVEKVIPLYFYIIEESETSTHFRTTSPTYIYFGEFVSFGFGGLPYDC